MSESELLLVPDFSKGPNKIKIDGGCTYDYNNHVVIHNSGPFTNDGCLHAKWQDEDALADRVREEYAVEIDLAKLNQLFNQLEKRLENIEKKIPDDLEKRLDNIEKKIPDDLEKRLDNIENYTI